MRFHHRMLKPKKKERKTVTLKLEKNGEVQEVTMETKSLRNMLKIAKKLAGLNKDGWNVVEVTGNSEHVGLIKNLAMDYHPGDPIPVKEMLKEAGLSAVPQPLKNLLKKEEVPSKEKE